MFFTTGSQVGIIINTLIIYNKQKSFPHKVLSLIYYKHFLIKFLLLEFIVTDDIYVRGK